MTSTQGKSMGEAVQRPGLSSKDQVGKEGEGQRGVFTAAFISTIYYAESCTG